MALFRCSYRSKLLAKRVEFNLVLPEDCTGDVPVVMLLHGLSGNHD